MYVYILVYISTEEKTTIVSVHLNELTALRQMSEKNSFKNKIKSKYYVIRKTARIL